MKTDKELTIEVVCSYLDIMGKSGKAKNYTWETVTTGIKRVYNTIANLDKDKKINN